MLLSVAGDQNLCEHNALHVLPFVEPQHMAAACQTLPCYLTLWKEARNG
jgi:hypothetical protein